VRPQGAFHETVITIISIRLRVFESCKLKNVVVATRASFESLSRRLTHKLASLQLRKKVLLEKRKKIIISRELKNPGE
jgi:hypothetical protein